MTTFLESFEFWKLLLCLFGGVIGAFALYFKSTDFTKPQKRGLQILRFTAVFQVLLLLLGPDLRLVQNKYDKPIVSFLVDNSSSLKDYSGAIKKRIEADIQGFESKGYDVQPRSFNGVVESVDSINFTLTESPIVQSLNKVSSFYSGQPLERIVLYTDGIENTGASLQSVKFPHQVDVVAIGDTVPKCDLKIDKVYHNPTVFKGNEFVLRAELSSQLALNKSVLVKVKQGGKVVVSK